MKMKFLKKLLRPALFIMAFIIMIVCVLECQKEVDKKDSMHMNNTVVFGGIVTGLKVSGNHRFGVITLRIANHDLPVFNPAPGNKKDMLFPYKLQNGIAEVYVLVPSELSVGDSVYLNSKERLVNFFYTEENKQFEGRLMMIRSELDIDFVHENSRFR